MKSRATREERERRFAEALAAYESGRMTMTEARIAAGLASRPAWLAYRFPRQFGHLCAISAADKRRPVYAPDGGWHFARAERGVQERDRGSRPLRAPHPEDALGR
ncbi:MAG: hypothetical protein JF922_06470 [Candidatus Dormibacteraeota bacterium]|uniref:Uncharacterized protein n=1 Tax=Candidatus Nephthysia bennettiae TaxID=3127016 RepID=A0A934K8N5_9BACT|nr:hypothetical protein [Candidatus Dormibacteraeota bacterium]